MWFDDPDLEFRNRVGFDESVQSEPVDGLILMDIRTIEKKHFFEKWTDNKWGFFFQDSYYDFSLSAVGLGGNVKINMSVFNNYEGARQAFLDSAVTSRTPYPWNKCSKNFGTICASLQGEIFFIYRNIFISISSLSRDTIEQTAEWFCDVLKNFPRSPMNAPFKLRDSIDNDPKALYEKAIQSEPLKSEPIDGLILTDIRMIRRPTFVDKWAENGWNYFASKDHYSFGWKAVGEKDRESADVSLEIFNSYEAARKAFFIKVVATFAPYPWLKCGIAGTLCADSRKDETLSYFFVYRNIIASIDTPRFGAGILDQTTEWLFKVLEDFPRSPMNAPFVLRGPKEKTP